MSVPEALPFPLPLEAYGSEAGMTLGQVLVHRVAMQPMNAVATAIFFLAILHTFFAARILKASHHLRQKVEAEHGPGAHSIRVEVLHFLGIE